MKKILFRLMPFLFVGLLTGCQGDETIPSLVVEGAVPVSSFTYSKEFLNVKFTSTSINAESYYWDFGDGTYSTEESPAHTYAASGDYTVTLKVNSVAGYSAKSEPASFYVAGKAMPFFTYSGGFGRNVNFDAGNSVNTVSVSWDFGDGSEIVEGFKVSHEFPADGTYTVTLTAVGLTGDISPYMQDIIVVGDYNLIKGSDMEASSASYWSSYSVFTWGEQVTAEFGHTEDRPSGGDGGCLVFKRYAGGERLFFYQAIDVEEGQKYLYSAQVKLPKGTPNGALRFYITDEVTSDGNPDFVQVDGVLYFEFTAETVFDGDLTSALWGGTGNYTTGTHGIYTAEHSGKIYVGFGAYAWDDSGASWLIDNVKFELQVEP